MFRKALTRYLLVWLTLTCVLAFFWEDIHFLENVWDPFKISARFTQVLISIAMLVIGSLLPLEEIRQVARDWPKIIGGTATQFITMPLLAFAAAELFGLDKPYYIGMILVGCVPGAMASNLLTMIGRGNVSYSVGLTTSSTLLSPLMVPFLLKFFLKEDLPVDFSDMSLTLLRTVVCPVIVGFTLSRLSSLWKRCADFSGESIGNIVIIWIIAAVVGANRHTFDSSVLVLILPLLLINIGGYFGGWLGGKILRIDYRMRRALMIEVGMQNAGLGAFLARNYFQDTPQTALCCALYTFGCMFTGIILVQIFRALTSPEDQPSGDSSTGEGTSGTGT